MDLLIQIASELANQRVRKILAPYSGGSMGGGSSFFIKINNTQRGCAKTIEVLGVFPDLKKVFFTVASRKSGVPTSSITVSSRGTL